MSDAAPCAPRSTATVSPGLDQPQRLAGVGVVGYDRAQLAELLAVEHSIARVDQIEAAVLPHAAAIELDFIDRP
jgi:hypothetical protein